MNNVVPMPNNENEEVLKQVEAEAEFTPDENPQPKKRTRAPKARSIDELVEVPVKNMTDKEKTIYIEHLQEELLLANNKIEHFKNSNESALKQTRYIEENFESMEAFYKERMAFIQNNAKNFYQSICLATKGDVK